MQISERLNALRGQMAVRGITVYVVPTSDFHESEYVGEHFKARKFITGFTGSAGTAVITMDHAGLWTDARYFLQAERQLEGSGVTLYKMAEEGVPTVREFVENALSSGGKLAFDGRVVNSALGKAFSEIASKKGAEISMDEDLIDLIWDDRPPLSAEPVWVLPLSASGKTSEEKIADLRRVMREKGASTHLLTSLYDIAWLLNVRGGDVENVPVVLSYLMINDKDCFWFVNEAVLSHEVKEYIASIGVTVRPYDDFYAAIASLSAGEKVLLDKGTVNTRALGSIPSGVEVIDAPNPTVLMKSIKNAVEMANTRVAHIKDAVAMTKFMIWLKTNIGKIPMTEISVSDKLEALRRENEGFLDLSFGTISGYAHHGAIVHYGPTPESDIPLKPEGLLLVDSGAHYLEGTTDITRTFALGPVTDEMKKDFTRVLISNLTLANARFLYGCSGMNLDILAREPLWEVNADFKHGTGHGVGHILSVHEGPNGFRWRKTPDRSEGSTLEEGMITTDEPGIYIEGKYGIRTENELLCRKGVKNEYGQFMYFEQLTFVPIDLDAVDVDMLTYIDKKRLNDYHSAVYDTVSPYLTDEEKEILKTFTRAI